MRSVVSFNVTHAILSICGSKTFPPTSRYMDRALEQLEFKCMEEVTTDTLKRAFKEAVVRSHPDRGGKDGDFDANLSAYVYLSGVLKRTSGGRDGFQTLHVQDVRAAREDQFVQELNNLVSNIFDNVDREDHSAFQKEFNEQFDRLREEERGYEEWFRGSETDTALKDGVYGTATMKDRPTFEQEQLNAVFESTLRLGKPPVTTLMLHPDQMACFSARPAAMTLIRTGEERFTSDLDHAPEYTDLQDAYTQHNTVFDKLPAYEDKKKTFEELLKEREMVYQTEHDRDLEAIAAYEKRKQEEDKAHKQRIGEYFKKTVSSQWALHGVFTKDGDSFVKEI